MTNIPSKKCKTLIEQYRKGKLHTGFYYANLFQYDGEDSEDRDFEDIVFYSNNTNKFVYEDCYDGVSNIIDKVPDYDQFAELSKKVDELEKKLDIAISALNDYADKNWYNRYALDEDDEMPELAKETLNRIEEVK
ncbi:MAG: hypothetical protein KBT03_09720 [Bacteroidales bacterium]|nr:hypothetical protein [Candidatus Scybalousia scybalohippi]